MGIVEKGKDRRQRNENTIPEKRQEGRVNHTRYMDELSAAVSAYQGGRGKYDGIGFCLTEMRPSALILTMSDVQRSAMTAYES